MTINVLFRTVLLQSWLVTKWWSSRPTGSA